MLEYLGYVLPYFIEYRYWAIFIALTVAGLGVPIPEELTIVVSGYLTAIGELHWWLALPVCYAGVLAGDIVTYCLGRFGASHFLETSYARWMISRERLEKVQYYYRGYGPYFLLVARQVAGLRFPSFFTAGMVKMTFLKFLVFDGLAALVSMPVVFLVAYFFGPRLEAALRFILEIRDITFMVALCLILLTALVLLTYWFIVRRKTKLES